MGRGGVNVGVYGESVVQVEFEVPEGYQVTEMPWDIGVHSKGESQARGGKVDEAGSQVASN